MLRRLIVVAAVGLCLVVPAAAHASWHDVLDDCVTNNGLTKKYTQKEYRDALANMPTDADEYSDCRSVIEHARLAALAPGKKKKSSGSGTGSSAGSGGSGGTGSGGGTGSTPAPSYATLSPTDQAKVKQEADRAARTGGGEHRVANVDVSPGALAYHDFDSVSKLPAPLVALAVLILASVLGASGYLVVTRVRSGGPRA